MQTNYHFLKQLAPEIKEKILGLKLMECFSQDKDEMVLGFAAARGLKNNYKQFFIRCSTKPEFPCLYLTKEYRRANKNTVDLWHDVYDLTVVEVKVFENERAIGVFLENNYTLVLKMFGNRSNLLIFKENDALHIFNQQLKKDFDLKLTQLDRQLIQAKDALENTQYDYKTIFPTFGKAILAHLKTHLSDDTSKLWEKLVEFKAEIENPPYYLIQTDDGLVLSLFKQTGISASYTSAIEATNAIFIYGQKQRALDKLRANLSKELNREKKHIENWLSKSKIRHDELQNGSRNEEIGHLIMSQMHLITENSTAVTLDDFYHQRSITVNLKKDLSPQKNAENYYRKARNEKLEVNNLTENILLKESRLQQIDEALTNIYSQENLKTLRKLETPNSQKQTIAEKTPHELFKIFEIDGYEIRVGKNAANNDLLTLKYCKKDDTWLHARDVSGSHVVIKQIPGRKIPEQVLEKAAGIAAYYSKRKNDSLAPVIFTQKKFIRKAKGSAPGAVIVEKEEVILVPPALP